MARNLCSDKDEWFMNQCGPIVYGYQRLSQRTNPLAVRELSGSEIRAYIGQKSARQSYMVSRSKSVEKARNLLVKPT